MHWVWIILVVLLNTVWLGLVLLGLPGTWFMVLTAVGVAWWQSYQQLPPDQRIFAMWTLAALVALALVGEILEFAAGAAGARTTGASRRGAIGALVGGLVGAIAGTFLIPIPLLGSLIGAAAGAALAAGTIEWTGGRSVEHSVKAGMGAGVGRAVGTLAKLAVGAVIWLIAAVAAFWP